MGARADRIVENREHHEELEQLLARERAGAERRGEHIKDGCNRLLAIVANEGVRLPADCSNLRREFFHVLSDHFYSVATPIDIPDLKDDPAQPYDPAVPLEVRLERKCRRI